MIGNSARDPAEEIKLQNPQIYSSHSTCAGTATFAILSFTRFATLGQHGLVAGRSQHDDGECMLERDESCEYRDEHWNYTNTELADTAQYTHPRCYKRVSALIHATHHQHRLLHDTHAGIAASATTPNSVLMGVCRALAHVDNRALTPRQIVDVAHSVGIIKLGGNTPASTVSTHIRAHLARGTPALLLRHSLQPRPRHPSDAPTIEDRAIGPNADGTSERKKGTAWYLSEAAGFLSPWDRLGIPKPKEPDPDQSVRPSPSPAPVAPSPTPTPVEPQPQPQRMSSRKRTRTKSWGAAARELGLDGLSPPPDFDDESEVEAHRERKSKVRIRLRFGSVTSRSSSVRPDDSSPRDNDDDSDLEEASQCSHSFPIRNRVFSAPCPQLTHSRRSLSNPSSDGPPTPHALADAEDSDVEDGDFHVRMMCNSDSAPSSPCKPADQVPPVGIGLGLIFEGSNRSVKVKEESESMSPPSLSSRASSLAASSLPEDDVWAVKIEETEDVKAMVVDAPSFDPPDLCESGLGFDFTTACEGIELEFAMLGVHSPTVLPNAFIRDPDHIDGPESVRLDEVDRIWSDWGDKRAHTRSLRTARNSSSKRREPTWGWGCRAAPGMRVSLSGAQTRTCDDRAETSRIVLQQERNLKIDKTVLHGVEYASYIVRGCVLLRRLEDAYVNLSALLRACRVPGSCHAQFRTGNTIDVSSPPSDASEVSNSTNIPAPMTSLPPAADSSDVIHNNSSSDVVNPGAMPQGASIDFGTGVEAADVSGMWCPLADARSVAEERLRPYLPEHVRSVFLGDTLELRAELEPEHEPESEGEGEARMETDSETPESKGDEILDLESKTNVDERGRRDDTPVAPMAPHEKVLVASEEDVSVFMRPSSPATVPCVTVRRVLRSRPARVVRTRARA
ncbi:hypothetical protein V565_003170 [Rhizoctonia solani 123E]|uniref:GDS1 winged helix domain-containing protein n=1 Tax=Rhizoctonia solani 123E TaxID=1423351 RepID=A0A074SFG3_9AGAM|nr:hypothetical protein V565_003170 [Rhizoctonia solani 123E]